jgi:hypothetical protein
MVSIFNPHCSNVTRLKLPYELNRPFFSLFLLNENNMQFCCVFKEKVEQTMFNEAF